MAKSDYGTDCRCMCNEGVEVGCSYEARSGFLNLCSVSERAIMDLEWF